jgi:cytochrome c oxidase cbb3-type subunit 3
MSAENTGHHHTPGSGSSSDGGEPPILDHGYDGIKEYDNPMPAWWTWSFWLCIFFSLPYFVYYHMGVGSSIHADYEGEMGAFFEQQSALLGDLQPDAVTLVSLLDDERAIKGGGNIFKTNCAVCHGPGGIGQTGPNLTDDVYLNIKSIEDIATIVRDGLVSKGMPAWGQKLNQTQIVIVSAYVASLRDTNGAGGKAPQGTPIAPWPTESLAPDTTPVAAVTGP